MAELIYDAIYDARYAELLDIIEKLEREPLPIEACAAASFESGLTAYDLQRIIRNRDRYPHWRDERFVPPLFVQKVMLRDGHYGEQERATVLRHDGELTRHYPAPDEPKKGLG